MKLARFNVAFIRHANTALATPDIARVLTAKGRRQARAAGQTYLRGLAPLSPLVLCSAAGRCVETATLALGEGAATPEYELVRSQVLYDGMLQPEGSAAFGRLGYASLSAYHADSEGVRSYLEAYAKDALDEIESVAHRSSPSPDEERQTLCVFGHAVCAPPPSALRSSCACPEGAKQSGAGASPQRQRRRLTHVVLPRQTSRRSSSCSRNAAAFEAHYTWRSRRTRRRRAGTW